MTTATSSSELHEITQEDMDVIMRKDLRTFIHRCFCELYPSQALSEAPHLQIVAAKLADTLLGRGPKRLVICLPPRSLKSLSISVAGVAWILGLDPTQQIVCASYGQDLADTHARDTRTLMQSSFYRRIFPGTSLTREKLAVNDFYTTANGFRMATSVGGVLTGRGGNILIIDDPLKPDDALSDTSRNAVNAWFTRTLLSRQNNKEDGIIIIVMQRLHQDDLVGHVLADGDEWEVVSFPAIAEKDERLVVNTHLGEYVFERKVGDVLDPSRESLSTLQGMRRSLGLYDFNSQYQQNPTPPGGSMILSKWLQYYDPSGPLPKFTSVVQSWDTANKSGELNDYSVCTTWGVYAGHYYLLDVLRMRLNYPDLKRQVGEQMREHNPQSILIEDKASGTQLIQELRAGGNWRVKAYEAPPQIDKIMRVNSVTALFEAGKVILPSSSSWLAEYERELLSFPGSKFDDQVDSTTQALNFFAKNNAMDTWVRLGKATLS